MNRYADKSSEFDFDTPIDRRNTASMKWDRYKDRDVLPLWVADMDFRSPPAVEDALKQRIEHGVLGYTRVPGELTERTLGLLDERYGWQVQPEWLIWLPGVVPGLNISCRIAANINDEILTAIPVYPPFLTAPGNSKRQLKTFSLVQRSGR